MSESPSSTRSADAGGPAPGGVRTPPGYDALRESAALLTHEERGILEVRGGEAREHFGGLLTNHVEGLDAGEGVYAFMLTAKGRPVAEMRVLAVDLDGDEEVLWADLPAACLDGALDHLGRFLPPRLAGYDRIAGLRRIGLVGPRARSVLEEAGIPVPARGPLAHRSLPPDAPGEARRVARREEIEGPGFDLYVPEEGRDELGATLTAALGAVGGSPADARAWEIFRVERGLPVYGREIHPDVLPQETDQQGRAVDFDKGCYTGQEVVARIHYRGKVNRRLRGLRFDASTEDLPAPETELHGDGRPRGTVTSAVRSPRLGPIGLGYVRREVDAGDRLSVGGEDGPPCTVVELPFVPG